MRSFKRTSADTVLRVLGAAIFDAAELMAVCIFIGAIGVWAQFIATI